MTKNVPVSRLKMRSNANVAAASMFRLLVKRNQPLTCSTKTRVSVSAKTRMQERNVLRHRVKCGTAQAAHAYVDKIPRVTQVWSTTLTRVCVNPLHKLIKLRPVLLSEMTETVTLQVKVKSINMFIKTG